MTGCPALPEDSNFPAIPSHTVLFGSAGLLRRGTVPSERGHAKHHLVGNFGSLHGKTLPFGQKGLLNGRYKPHFAGLY